MNARVVKHLPAVAGSLSIAWLALSGCTTPATTGAPDVPAAVPSRLPSEAAAGARRYVVDAGRTQVLLLVRRTGALSKLGHNHAIVSDAEQGRAWISADGRSAGLEVRLPVGRFVVDDAGARATAGPEFAAPVPDDARAGTFGNMTGERVLDAARFPDVVVRYSGDTPLEQSAPVRITVEIKGQTHVLDVPMVVVSGDREIAASGETRVLQSSLGLEPFSILGGAIAVADEIVVRFEFVATRTDASG